jgi:hypothetical protein
LLPNLLNTAPKKLRAPAVKEQECLTVARHSL